jgi:hypothetical protein
MTGTSRAKSVNSTGPRRGPRYEGSGHDVSPGSPPALRLWNPHRPVRRPRSRDSTGPEAVESPPASAAAAVRGFHRPRSCGIPTGQCRGPGPGIPPALKLWNPHRPVPRRRSGDFTGPKAVESPPASAAAAVRGFHRPKSCGIPAGRRGAGEPIRGAGTGRPHY